MADIWLQRFFVNTAKSKNISCQCKHTKDSVCNNNPKAKRVKRQPRKPSSILAKATRHPHRKVRINSLLNRETSYFSLTFRHPGRDDRPTTEIWKSACKSSLMLINF